MSFSFDHYESVMGFECHVQLNTKSKLFSRAKNQFSPSPNENISVVDVGFPGVLPTINEEAVNSAIKLGLALGCTIHHTSIFARKHYFYPDLPKGYQISQYDKPICENGHLDIMMDGQKKRIRINRIHIEEDAGKNIHSESNVSYVDYNRAGTPLLEVVTEPDIRSKEEAALVFKALRQIVVFLGICDGNMQEGSLRADINVSVRKKGDSMLGTRTETKNLNSFRFLKQAIQYEVRRQIMELESGRKIIQETRLFDPNMKETRSMRSKEDAHDYRYFPDPDLPPLVLNDSIINHLKQDLCEMPLAKLERYQKEYALSEYDAELLASNKQIADFFEEALSYYQKPKNIANWIINDLLRELKGSNNSEGEDIEFSSPVPAKAIADLVKAIDDGCISSKNGKKVFALLLEEPTKNVDTIIQEHDLKMSNDDGLLLSVIDQVIKEYPQEIDSFNNGKDRAFGFLMGQVMKKSGGKVNPKEASKLLREKIEHKTKG